MGSEDHVICALSGGVDSAVAALLVHKVLRERLHCVFVDNGLLRYKVAPHQLHSKSYSLAQLLTRFPFHRSGAAANVLWQPSSLPCPFQKEG